MSAPPPPLLAKSARELAALLARKALSPVELVESTLARIDDCQPTINAFITVARDAAREAAREAERELLAGRRRGPLHGLPYAAKDLIRSAGLRTTMGSRLHEASVPEHDAVAIARLRAGGAILVGKTTTSEFGHKALTDGPLFGRTLNPVDAEVTCGGSSGGSAAALASDQVPLALGSDGGGSIRIPAACCGVAGLKPTLGAVPHLDVPDLFSAHSYVGPMARNVEDLAFLFQSLRGFDRRDPYGQGAPPVPPPASGPASTPASTTAPASAPASASTSGSTPASGSTLASGPSLASLRVGWMETVGNPVTDPECIGAAARAAGLLEEAGAAVEPVEVDFAPVASAFLVILESALCSRLAEHRERTPERLDPSLVETIDRGARWSAVDLQRAARERSACFGTVQSLFERFDLLASPVLAAPPLSIHQNPHGPVVIAGRDAGPIRSGWYPYTLPFNLSGHPALALPCGRSASGLPLGVQLVGPWHSEDLLLEVGARLEAELGEGP